jgi:cation diffusion facilitator CzcD-associated flavoprotein CzcO
MAEINRRIKAIIIGAGISGLGCAEALNKHKDLFDVTILEARNVGMLSKLILKLI